MRMYLLSKCETLVRKLLPLLSFLSLIYSGNQSSIKYWYKYIARSNIRMWIYISSICKHLAQDNIIAGQHCYNTGNINRENYLLCVLVYVFYVTINVSSTGKCILTLEIKCLIWKQAVIRYALNSLSELIACWLAYQQLYHIRHKEKYKISVIACLRLSRTVRSNLFHVILLVQIIIFYLQKGASSFSRSLMNILRIEFLNQRKGPSLPLIERFVFSSVDLCCGKSFGMLQKLFTSTTFFLLSF